MSATPCQGCGAELDCAENDYLYTLTGDPTLPYAFFCPQTWPPCLPPPASGWPTDPPPPGTTPTITNPTCGPIYLVCCSHQIVRQVCSNTTAAQLSAIIASMLTECQQYAGECNDPPTTPGPGPTIPPAKLYFSAAKTCTVTCPDGTAFLGTARAGLFVATTQAAADAQAQAYACTQANNLKRCGINALDMPLDQAVYVPAVGGRAAFIAGVRGGYVFKLDPTTGAKVSSRRYSPYSIYPARIAYEPVNDSIIVAYRGSPNFNFKEVGFSYPRYLYVLSPNDLYEVSSYDPNLDTVHLNPIVNAYSWPYSGVTELLTLPGGEVLCGLSMDPSGGRWVFVRNITTATSREYSGAYPQVRWESFYERQGFVLNGNSTKAYGLHHMFSYASGLTVINLSTVSNDQTGPRPSGVGLGVVYGTPISNVATGITYLPSQDMILVSSASAKIFRCTGAYLESLTSDNNPTDTTDLTLPDSDASPFAIQYNPYDGKAYVPGYTNNKVYIIDPSSGYSIVTKTGFDSPFDCVFTPTKKFAVQHGAQGLKEIL